MEFQLEDEQLETPVVPAAGKEKEAKDETVTLSKAEVEARPRDRDEARQSEKYWANIARSGGSQAEHPAEEANDGLDASEFLDEEAGDTGLEGDTPEKLVDDLAARGVSAIAKRGFITAKDAHKIAAEMAIKISRKLIGRERQKITSDTQIMSEFPELKDQSSELFKETARIYQAAVAMATTTTKSARPIAAGEPTRRIPGPVAAAAPPTSPTTCWATKRGKSSRPWASAKTNTRRASNRLAGQGGDGSGKENSERRRHRRIQDLLCPRRRTAGFGRGPDPQVPYQWRADQGTEPGSAGPGGPRLLGDRRRNRRKERPAERPRLGRQRPGGRRQLRQISLPAARRRQAAGHGTLRSPRSAEGSRRPLRQARDEGKIPLRAKS